jgi:hypothetical protein
LQCLLCWLVLGQRLQGCPLASSTFLVLVKFLTYAGLHLKYIHSPASVETGCVWAGLPTVSSLERLESLHEGEPASFSKASRNSFSIEANAATIPLDGEMSQVNNLTLDKDRRHFYQAYHHVHCILSIEGCATLQALGVFWRNSGLPCYRIYAGGRKSWISTLICFILSNND